MTVDQLTSVPGIVQQYTDLPFRVISTITNCAAPIDWMQELSVEVKGISPMKSFCLYSDNVGKFENLEVQAERGEHTLEWLKGQLEFQFVTSLTLEKPDQVEVN